ncbi:hypothetical protein ABZP36_009169 [Zizania latifolia]
MEHFQGQQQHGHPAPRFDEYGNPVTAGQGITGTHDAGAGGYGATGTGAQPGYRGGPGTGSYDAGAQTGTGTHDAGGYGGFATTGTGPGIDGAGGLITGHPAGVHHGAGGLGMDHTAGYGTTGTEVGHGPGGFGTGHTAGHGTSTTGTGVHGVQPAREEHRTGGILHRSGSSSSSSSSEDDGMGGRRKKGIKEKIKEKLPGGHKGTSQQQTTAATGGYGAHGHTGTAASTGAGTTTYPATEGTHEKKGMMEKIKEKLPGGHH